MWLGFFLLLGAAYGAGPIRYVLISSPNLSKLSYVRVNDLSGEVGEATPLALSAEGLDKPKGICIDLPRKRIFVADDGESARKVFFFDIEVKGNELVLTSTAKVAASNVDVAWCAVDHVGNLYYTETGSNVVKRVSADLLEGEAANPVSETIYSNYDEISGPAGIAADNFHVFWTNSNLGATYGSIVRGMAGERAGLKGIAKIAQNAVSSQGVCVVGQDLYFTEAAQNLNALRKTGGPIVPVAGVFNEPKGCSWDGDGTVYIADSAGNALYAIPVPSTLQTATVVKKIVDLENSYGVAVFEEPGNVPWVDQGSATESSIFSVFMMMSFVFFT